MKLQKKMSSEVTGIVTRCLSAMLLSLLLVSCSAWTQEPKEVERAEGITDLCWGIRGLVLSYATNPSRTWAQIEQESSCRARVKSWDNGIGLAQFTGKKNTEWIARTYCSDLGMPKPELAEWSVKCMDRYMLSFKNKGLTICQGWRFDEAAYNGGQGWLNKEKKAASKEGEDPRNYWSVRTFCDTTGRSSKSCGWNREYTEHIDRRQKKYTTYGGNICN